MKEIKDYLHLYLGCECKDNVTGQVRKLHTVYMDLNQRPVYELQNIDVVTTFYSEEFKPILRPLSDMTEEEINECWKILEWSEMITTPSYRRNALNEEFLDSDEGRECGWFSFIKILPYLLKQSFDLFNLIPEGLAIDKITLVKTQQEN
jgi:hypothetical protein